MSKKRTDRVRSLYKNKYTVCSGLVAHLEVFTVENRFPLVVCTLQGIIKKVAVGRRPLLKINCCFWRGEFPALEFFEAPERTHSHETKPQQHQGPWFRDTCGI